MKYIITTQENIYGPYDSVNTLLDCYEVTGGGRLPFVVIGESTLSEVADDYKTPAQIEQEAKDLEQEKINYNNYQKQQRAKAYQEKSDPLFFKAQRGEATLDEWTAKVEEIKARYPYQV